MKLPILEFACVEFPQMILTPNQEYLTANLSGVADEAVCPIGRTVIPIYS
jgi:hypothetical protein